jgi:hypothetical protein
MAAAEEPDVVHRRRAPERLRGPVIELDLVRRPANPASVHRPLAAAAVRAGVRVREGVARGVELRDELPGHGGVEPRELGRERLDTVALPVGSWGVHGACGRVGIERFNRRTYGRRRRFTVRRRRTELQGCGGRTRRGDPHRRHHVATRRVLDRLQLGDELQRFLLGETEEPRKHLGLVLGRRGCDAARDRPCLLRGRPEGRSRTRTPAERCVRSLLARWCPAKRARAEIASSDPLGSLERDCSGPYKSERARRSRRRTGFLRADPRGRGSRARNRPGRPPSSLPFCTTAEQSAPRAQCRRKGVPVEM